MKEKNQCHVHVKGTYCNNCRCGGAVCTAHDIPTCCKPTAAEPTASGCTAAHCPEPGYTSAAVAFANRMSYRKSALGTEDVRWAEELNSVFNRWREGLWWTEDGAWRKKAYYAKDGKLLEGDIDWTVDLLSSVAEGSATPGYESYVVKGRWKTGKSMISCQMKVEVAMQVGLGLF